jgi:hypothetical protein
MLIRAQMLVVAVAVSLACGAAPALARWHLFAVKSSSIAYNQGIAFDGARGGFFFDGVSSLTNSGLYRVDARRGPAANTAVIPQTIEGYNHAGDLSFDPVRRRILLPLECYYPISGGNTCGAGAIGVADPVTLRLRYYVDLARRQIRKAMWAEISPDGRWVWTSSGTHLLAYRATDVSESTAGRQQSSARRPRPGIVGVDLGPVLPSGAVTGAAFYQDRRARPARLLLSLNLGARFEVVSFRTATTSDGRPKLLDSHPSVIITMARSTLNNEPEGLTTTARNRAGHALGGRLLWQMLPTITPSTVFSRTLTFDPAR